MPAQQGSGGLVLSQAIPRHDPFRPALVAKYGVLAFDQTPLDAARLVPILEEAAEVTIYAGRLGCERTFMDGARERKHLQMPSIGCHP